MADGSKLGVDKIRSAIADILETKELDSLTSRMVRNTLEQRFSVGLKDRKKEIDELLMSMIEEREERRKKDGSSANGAAEENQESEEEDLEIDDKPLPKKAKKEKATEQKSAKKEKNDDSENGDAEVARKLQESEKGLRKRKQPAKRTPKSTPKKSTGEKSKTGFGKMMVLSPDLAKIVGADQDPKDKRFHICDDELLKVFGKKRVQTFSMMKYLKQHVKDPSLIS